MAMAERDDAAAAGSGREVTGHGQARLREASMQNREILRCVHSVVVVFCRLFLRGTMEAHSSNTKPVSAPEGGHGCRSAVCSIWALKQ